MVVLFGVLSFIYFIQLSSFKSKINTLTALRAFQISLKLDTHQFSNDIPRAINQCDLTILRTCIPLLEALNIYRNRIIDYQFLVTNSMQLDSTDLLYQSLDDELLRIDSFMMRKFLYNFTMAKSNSITTIDGIFQEISDINSPSAVNYRVLKPKDNKFFGKTSDFLDALYKRIEKQENSFDLFYQQKKLQSLLIGILFLEVLIFLLVNGVDIAINSKSNKNLSSSLLPSISFRKIQPLSASIMFALFVMLLTQYLFIQQSKFNIFQYCRNVLDQNIKFSNLVKTKVEREILISSLKMPEKCADRLDNESIIRIGELKKDPSYTLMEWEFNLEIQRLIADSYQRLEVKRNSSEELLLFAISALNIFCLLGLSVFLRLDSKENE